MKVAELRKRLKVIEQETGFAPLNVSTLHPLRARGPAIREALREDLRWFQQHSAECERMYDALIRDIE